MAQPDEELLKPWSAAAKYWEKHRDIIGKMFAPATLALVEAAAIGRGSAVLDVGAGPGEPALSIAALVGADGRVCGIDPVAEMVAAARREADRLRLGTRHSMSRSRISCRFQMPPSMPRSAASERCTSPRLWLRCARC